MDLSTMLECSGLGHLREILEEEELDLECLQSLKLSDLVELSIDEVDRDPLMNLIDQLRWNRVLTFKKASPTLQQPPILPSPARAHKSGDVARVSGSMVELGGIGLSREEVSEATLRRCDDVDGELFDVPRAMNFVIEYGGDQDALLAAAPLNFSRTPASSAAASATNRARKHERQLKDDWG
jgi:hypothetical protein